MTDADSTALCPRCGAELQLVWAGQAAYRRVLWHEAVDDAQLLEATHHDESDKQ
jgi:phage terminase large subunit GpA-like protein